MEKVLEFLKDKRVCVLATVTQDGMPQTAVVHFSHQENPLKFFFFTSKESRKVKNAQINPKASMVVGWDEADFTTIQMDGEVHTLEGKELEEMKENYFTKYPMRKQFAEDEDSAFLVFLPKWIRYTNLKAKPKEVEVINIPD